jgi:hypothetical protein
MKRFRPIGLALLAMFAVAAASAATASAALPEFETTATLTGKSKAGEKTILQTLAGTKVECESGATKSGKATEKTKQITGVVISFTGCKSSGFSCESSGAGAGNIVTNEITATLGYINKTAKTVGLLFAVAKAGGFFVEFNCAGGIVKNKVLGQLICPIEPVNTKTTKFTLTCKQEKGDQAVTKFEGGETEVLKTSVNGGTEEDSAQGGVAEITSSVTEDILA